MSVRGPWDLESPQGFGKRLRDTSFECKWRSGIHQNLGTDEGLGRKETIFGRAMTEVRDTGSYDNDSQQLLQFYIKKRKKNYELLCERCLFKGQAEEFRDTFIFPIF